MSRSAVLVADDDPDFREVMRTMIEGWGSLVLEAADFAEVVDVARSEHRRIGLVLLDYFMPGDRATAVEALRDIVGADEIVLTTACGDVRRRAAELQLSRTLPKPVDVDALEAAIRGMG